MTPEQLDNWRRVLPLGRFLSDEAIIAFRDNIQNRINSIPQLPLNFDEGDTVKVIGKGKGTIKPIGHPYSVVKWAWGGSDNVDNVMIESYNK